MFGIIEKIKKIPVHMPHSNKANMLGQNKDIDPTSPNRCNSVDLVYVMLCWLMVDQDYQGQQYAEKVFNVILVLFGICGFCWGYYKQQFHLTFLILLAGFLLSCIVVLPPWPCYRRNPLPWQKSRENSEKNEAKKDARKKPKAN